MRRAFDVRTPIFLTTGGDIPDILMKLPFLSG